MRKPILFGVLWVLVGCTHQEAVDNHRPVGPNQATHKFYNRESGTPFASDYAAEAAPTVNKFNHTEKPFLAGECKVQAAKGTNIEIPCQNVVVVVSDIQGKLVIEVPVDRGKFKFNVEKDKSYVLGIKSHKLRLKHGKEVYAKEGDEVILTLVPK